MKKYILFAAKEIDCSCRFRRKGDWRATKYVLYSDGVCYETTEYVDKPERTRILRMDAAKFAHIPVLKEIKELLEQC